MRPSTALAAVLGEAMRLHLGRRLAMERANHISAILTLAEEEISYELLQQIVHASRTVSRQTRWADCPTPSVTACEQATESAWRIVDEWQGRR